MTAATDLAGNLAFGALLAAPAAAFALSRAAVAWGKVDRKARRSLLERCATFIAMSILVCSLLGAVRGAFSWPPLAQVVAGLAASAALYKAASGFRRD